MTKVKPEKIFVYTNLVTERGNVINLAFNNHPEIGSGVVLGDFFVTVELDRHLV